MLLADGFDEIETVVILSTLRRAGTCIKSVGLTSGLINSVHGVLLMPDFALTDLGRLIAVSSIEMVILPGGEQSLAKLGSDPRIHRLLCQVIAQQSFVAINSHGMQILQAALTSNAAEGYNKRDRVILRYPLEQTVEQFAQNLAYRLERSLH